MSWRRRPRFPRIRPPAADGVRDLRSLLWSSIDNDTSRDLDQIEVAEAAGDGIRIRVGIADVDSRVAPGSPDRSDTRRMPPPPSTPPSRRFPMLPERLSTDVTSLNENVDRQAIVVEMVVAADGSTSERSVYRALVHNRAQLTYNGVGPWLEGKAAAPPKVAESARVAGATAACRTPRRSACAPPAPARAR